MLQVTDFLRDRHVQRGANAPTAPAVSVTLPTYRRCQSGQLRRAIESVVTQTFEDFELIIIDDGSTDGSADLIDQFRAKDPRIVHVRHEQNSGIHSVRLNEGIALSRGRYVAFQFDDDVWRPHALQTLVHTLEQADELSVAVGHAHFTGPSGSWSLPNVELNLVSLYEQNRFANNAVLLPRECVERYGMYDCHIGMRRLCDWDLWLRLMKHVPFVVATGAADHDDCISEVHENTPGSLGQTVPWDIGLFRYLHDIPRNDLLTPAAWQTYAIDSLCIGDVELAGDFRRRVYEEQILPYYLQFRTRFPQLTDFPNRAPAPPPAPKTVLYTKNAYDVSNDVTLNHFDRLVNQRRSYKQHFQVLPQLQPSWPKEADVLLLVRVVEDEGRALVERALQASVPVGCYLDDDMLSFHEFGAAFDYLAPGTPYHTNLTTMLSQVDAVCVTTPSIAESVTPYTKRIIFHTNCVPDDWLPQTLRLRQPSQPLKIGYVGSGYREQEFACIWDALQRISEQYTDQLRFEFWGLDIQSFPSLASPTSSRPFTFSYFSYLQRLQNAEFDILLCPLLDHPRPRLGKSLIKYFETAVAGALGIFSDGPQYASVPDGLSCLKAANDAEAWYTALETAIQMPLEASDRMRWSCLRHVREEYTNTALVDRHEAALRAIEFHAHTRQQRHADGRPRILYVLHSAHYGGGEIQLWRRLRLLRDYGIEPIVILPQGLSQTPQARSIAARLSHEQLQLEFVEYTCFDHPRSPSMFCSELEQDQIRAVLARLQPVLVHTVTMIPSFGQICQELGIPHIMSAYALDETFAWADGAPDFTHCTLSQSDSLRYTQQWAEVLDTEGFCAREVAPEEFFRLGFCRSLQWDTSPPPDLSTQPLRIVMTGTLQVRKQQAEAIEAVGRLRQEGIDCRLDLYGYTHFFPDYKQRCDALINDFSLHDRVVFHGFTDQIAAVLEEADIVLSPSTFESFPSAIKEALAAGVLVVATPVGGIHELIVDHQTGILCADTSVEAIRDGLRRASRLSAAQYRHIVEAGRRIARIELHPYRAANDLMTMYLRTLDIHVSRNADQLSPSLSLPAPAAAAPHPSSTTYREDPSLLSPLSHRLVSPALTYALRPQYSDWVGLDVFVGTHQRPASGRLDLRMMTSRGALLRETAVPLTALPDNSWLSFQFAPIQHAAGQSFFIELRLHNPGPHTRLSVYETAPFKKRYVRLLRRLGQRLRLQRPVSDLYCRLSYLQPQQPVHPAAAPEPQT